MQGVVQLQETWLRHYEGVSSVILALSLKQPIVMFLDDLHLSPQMRLQLHIARRLPEYRLLIVYAYREDELIESPVLVAGRNELVRSRLVTDIQLAPLTQVETGRIIAHAFGESAAAQLQASTFEINKGNPFFVEEMVRYMVENSAVRWVQDRWEVLDTTRVGIPESVKRLVQERVARLGEEVVAMLQQELEQRANQSTKKSVPAQPTNPPPDEHSHHRIPVPIFPESATPNAVP